MRLAGIRSRASGWPSKSRWRTASGLRAIPGPGGGKSGAREQRRRLERGRQVRVGRVVVGVVAQLGALRLPRRQYTLGVAARRGRIEVDVTEALRIPGAGPKIPRCWTGGPQTGRARDPASGNLLTVGHPSYARTSRFRKGNAPRHPDREGRPSEVEATAEVLGEPLLIAGGVHGGAGEPCFAPVEQPREQGTSGARRNAPRMTTGRPGRTGRITNATPTPRITQPPVKRTARPSRRPRTTRTRRERAGLRFFDFRGARGTSAMR